MSIAPAPSARFTFISAGRGHWVSCKGYFEIGCYRFQLHH